MEENKNKDEIVLSKKEKRKKKILDILKYFSLAIFIIASLVILVEAAIPGDISADQSDSITDVVDDNINDNYDKENIIDINDLNVNFSINKESYTVSEKINYNVSFIPSNTTYKNIEIINNNEDLIKIDETNKEITFIKEGKGSITFKSLKNENIFKTFTFYIKEIPLTNFYINNLYSSSTLYLGTNEKIKLNISYEPLDATYKSFKYFSYDSSLIEIDEINNEIAVKNISSLNGFKEDKIYQTKLKIVSEYNTNLVKTINIKISNIYEKEIRNIYIDELNSNFYFYPSNTSNLLKINYSSYSSINNNISTPSFDLNKLNINIKNDEEKIIKEYKIKEHNLKNNYIIIEFILDDNKFNNNNLNNISKEILLDITYNNYSFNPSIKDLKININSLINLSSSLIDYNLINLDNNKLDIYKLNNYDLFYNDLIINITYLSDLKINPYKYNLLSFKLDLEDNKLFIVKKASYNKIILSINKEYLLDNNESLKNNYYLDIIFNNNTNNTNNTDDYIRFNINFNYKEEKIDDLSTLSNLSLLNLYDNNNNSNNNILIEGYTYNDLFLFDYSSLSSSFRSSYLINNIPFDIVTNSSLNELVTNNSLSFIYKDNTLNGIKINENILSNNNEEIILSLKIRNKYFDYLNIFKYDISISLRIRKYNNLAYKLRIDNKDVLDLNNNNINNNTYDLNINKSEVKDVRFVIYSYYFLNNNYQVYKEYDDDSLYTYKINNSDIIYFDNNKDIINGLNEGQTTLIFNSLLDNNISLKININVKYIPLKIDISSININIINNINNTYNIDKDNNKVALNNIFYFSIPFINKEEASSLLINLKIENENIISTIINKEELKEYIDINNIDEDIIKNNIFFKATSLGNTSLIITSKIDENVKYIKNIEVVDSISPFRIDINKLNPLEYSIDEDNKIYNLTLDYASSYSLSFVKEFNESTSSSFSYSFYEYNDFSKKLNEYNLVNVDSSNTLSFKDVGKISLKIKYGDESTISTYEIYLNLIIKRDTRFTFNELANIIRKGLGHYGLFLLTSLSGSIYIFLNFKKYLHKYIALIVYSFIGFLIGLTSEGIQALTPGRGPSFKDVLIDTFGFLSGVLIILVIFVIIQLFTYFINKDKNK